jgi:hypothetical protein
MEKKEARTPRAVLTGLACEFHIDRGLGKRKI